MSRRPINAIIEDTAQDNSCENSDRLTGPNPRAPVYDERQNISVHDAILWAETIQGRVTLYLYDEGRGV